MKLAFDHQIFSTQSYGGISRYFVRLAQGLIELGDEVDVIAPLHRNSYLKELPANRVHGYAFDSFPPKSSRLISFVNRHVSAMRLLKLRPMLLHETYYSARPVMNAAVGRVITVHDMIHEKFAGEFPANDPTSRNKRIAVARADHIICISQSTRNDLCQHFDVSEEKISVVHHGFEMFSKLALPTSPPPAMRPFLLYVGNRSGYKNFDRTLQAVASHSLLKNELDVLAFGGGPLTENELNLIGSLGLRSASVQQIGGKDQVLGALYRGAIAFVYPSLYEGFGLPPLESMAHDCPVVTSNTSSMPEVIGSAGEYFDPLSIEAQAEAIAKVVFDSSRREQLILEGRKRLNYFSWSKCARESRDVYRKVIQDQESK